MQLFSLIICFAKFTDLVRDVTDIRPPDRGLSRQESGLGSQDILSEKPWNWKKICWNHFYINRFRHFGAEKIFINSFSTFLKKLLRIIWNVKKNHFFPLPQKNADPRPCLKGSESRIQTDGLIFSLSSSFLKEHQKYPYQKKVVPSPGVNGSPLGKPGTP